MFEGKNSRAGKNQILLPQLFIPRPHPKLVLRPRLTALLRHVEEYWLILISAPAGFGKTTLLSQWLAVPECQHHRERAGWVSLERNLNLIRFWIYLVSAVETVDTGTGRDAVGLIDNAHGAVRVLDQVHANAEQAGRAGTLVETLALQAMAHQAGGSIHLALAALGGALLRAEPEGYIRLFLDAGPPMAAMFQPAGMRGIAPRYTGMLLARGATNQEIAQQLSIALTTAKKHVSDIIGKMGVSNRAQAAARP